MSIFLMESIKTGIFILAGMLCLPSFGGELRIGAAAVKITPPLGTPMAEYYFTRGAEGVHDDLYSKALVFETEGIRVAVVSCDIIEIPADLAAAIRSRAEKDSGIPSDNIMIGATHAHTGPVILYAEAISGQIRTDDVPFLDMVNAFRVIDVYERKGKPMDAEIQVFALGDEFAIVSLPGEIAGEILAEHALKLLNGLKASKSYLVQSLLKV